MNYQRITEGYMNQNVLRNLVTNRDLLIELQRQISSGKKFDKASDDIFSTTTILNSNVSLKKIDTYLKNIDTARSEIDTADKAILTSIDTVHKARELTIESLNATSGPQQMNIIGAQVDQLIAQIKDLGNTKLGSIYIFGGQNTSTAPFSDDSTTSWDVQYNGSTDGTYKRNIEISEGVTIPLNLSGDDVFGHYVTTNDGGTPNDPSDDTVDSQGLLGTLVSLKNELTAANPDKDVIRSKLGDLDNNLSTLLQSQSNLGGLLTRLDITENIHKDNKISLTDEKSKVQDIDYAKTISDLKFQETALQATLQVSSRIIQPSLMNYM